jgi:hypothetical protein
VVHFYNTPEVLPSCKPGNRGEKVACWPAPEKLGADRSKKAILKLTCRQEEMLVAFLETLTDSYTLPGKQPGDFPILPCDRMPKRRTLSIFRLVGVVRCNKSFEPRGQSTDAELQG